MNWFKWILCTLWNNLGEFHYQFWNMYKQSIKDIYWQYIVYDFLQKKNARDKNESTEEPYYFWICIINYNWKPKKKRRNIGTCDEIHRCYSMMCAKSVISSHIQKQLNWDWNYSMGPALSSWIADYFVLVTG